VTRPLERIAEHRVVRANVLAFPDPKVHVPVDVVADLHPGSRVAVVEDVRVPGLDRVDLLTKRGHDVDPDVEAGEPALVQAGAQRVLLVKRLQRPAVDDSRRAATDRARAAVAPERNQAVRQRHVTVGGDTREWIRQRRERFHCDVLLRPRVQLGVRWDEVDPEGEAPGNEPTDRSGEREATAWIRGGPGDDEVVLPADRDQNNLPDGRRSVSWGGDLPAHLQRRAALHAC